MNEQDKNLIWIPKIVFDNNPERTFVEISPLSALSILLKGNLTRKFNFDLNEYEEFQGSENPVVFENIYDLKMNCKFELHFYPFDSQHCFITVSFINSFRSSTVMLDKGLLKNNNYQMIRTQSYKNIFNHNLPYAAFKHFNRLRQHVLPIFS